MIERELLDHIYAKSARSTAGADARLLVGPGDDCAVVVINGATLLLKVDQVIEGRHFRRGTDPMHIAHKAMARPISDIAAMAGTPCYALCAATLPPGTLTEDGKALFDAVHNTAAALGCPVVGGDIATGAAGAPLQLSVSVVGTPHPVRGPVLRSTAKPGDEIWVTGSLGGSFRPADGLGKHLAFTPRLLEASWLAEALGQHLTSMMDISDGLGIDAGRIGAASGVCMVVDGSRVPVAPGSDLQAALRDGEDYELLFTISPGCALSNVCTATGTRLTRIGRVEPARPSGETALLQQDSGERARIDSSGWLH